MIFRVLGQNIKKLIFCTVALEIWPKGNEKNIFLNNKSDKENQLFKDNGPSTQEWKTKKTLTMLTPLTYFKVA